MAKNKRTIKAVANRTVVQDAKLREPSAVRILDSFVNFAQKMGIGADSPLTSGSYGFNPITRIRTLLEWIHRGSWLGGVAIDVVADDMTKMGVDLHDDISPADIDKLQQAAVQLAIW